MRTQRLASQYVDQRRVTPCPLQQSNSRSPKPSPKKLASSVRHDRRARIGEDVARRRSATSRRRSRRALEARAARRRPVPAGLVAAASGVAPGAPMQTTMSRCLSRDVRIRSSRCARRFRDIAGGPARSTRTCASKGGLRGSGLPTRSTLSAARSPCDQPHQFQRGCPSRMSPPERRDDVRVRVVAQIVQSFVTPSAWSSAGSRSSSAISRLSEGAPLSNAHYQPRAGCNARSLARRRRVPLARVAFRIAAGTRRLSVKAQSLGLPVQPRRAGRDAVPRPARLGRGRSTSAARTGGRRSSWQACARGCGRFAFPMTPTSSSSASTRHAASTSSPRACVADDHERCRAFADALRNERSAPPLLRIPSAALPGTENLVIAAPRDPLETSSRSTRASSACQSRPDGRGRRMRCSTSCASAARRTPGSTRGAPPSPGCSRCRPDYGENLSSCEYGGARERTGAAPTVWTGVQELVAKPARHDRVARAHVRLLPRDGACRRHDEVVDLLGDAVVVLDRLTAAAPSPPRATAARRCRFGTPATSRIDEPSAVMNGSCWSRRSMRIGDSFAASPGWCRTGDGSPPSSDGTVSSFRGAARSALSRETHAEVRAVAERRETVRARNVRGGRRRSSAGAERRAIVGGTTQVGAAFIAPVAFVEIHTPKGTYSCSGTLSPRRS